NAHVILEEAPTDETPEPAAAEAPTEAAGETVEATADANADGPVPLVLSAKTPEALRAQAQRLAAFLTATCDSAPGITDIGHTLAAARAELEHRAVVVASDTPGFVDALEGLAADGAGPVAGAAVTCRDGVVAHGVADLGSNPVFVFPGQGSQWEGMATELYGSSAVFRDRVDACADALAPYVDWSLTDVLQGEPGAPSLERLDVVQPVLWAVMVALAALWESHGVKPAAVIGHSQGEIAAATVAGALSLEDAAKVVALRAQALTVLTKKGGMVAVTLPHQEVRERLLTRQTGPEHDRAVVAAINGPSSTVVSGGTEALDTLIATCEQEGIQARRVSVDYASHSPHVEALHDQILGLLADIQPRSCQVAFHSTLTGRRLDDTAVLDAEYWYRNLRHTVQFGQVVDALIEQGHEVFVECSPHPVLAAGIQDALTEAGRDGIATGSLRRGRGGRQQWLGALGAVFVRGVAVDWSELFPAGRLVDLPSYAFQRERYWLEAPPDAGDVSALGLGEGGHPFFGAATGLAGGGLLVSGRLDVRAQPWMAGHAVRARVLVPGAALVEMASEAGVRVGAGRVAELVLEAPLELPAAGGVRLQVTVGVPDQDGSCEVGIYSQPEETEATEGWALHARGRLDAEPSTAAAATSTEWPPAGAEVVGLDGFYATLS
ncbi:acyltransferase domain-containing protein, partial [Streptomyces albospinus]|uniref:acyltransferase domain-containing protein n=1 Tax=Streptomyces albospinus TaxID=285515 RepID=UPI0016701217